MAKVGPGVKRRPLDPAADRADQGGRVADFAPANDFAFGVIWANLLRNVAGRPTVSAVENRLALAETRWPTRS
jgi:hypothetical protein